MAGIEGLNEDQRHAVETPCDVVQILAPPGSGKTKTLTSRVAHLLSHHNYTPPSVICLTFTIKSAREMKERLMKIVGEETGSRVTLGTFHSVCRRYLCAYGRLIGLKSGFGIADSGDSQVIVQRIIKRKKLTIDARQARTRISRCKAKGIGWEGVRQEGKGRPSEKQIVDQQEFVTVFQQYEEHLQVSNLLDYDDLLLRCVQLLEKHPGCIANVEAVLIDEFQDTNVVQFELMRLFAQKHKRVTTVGDPDQSIYGWRSAEITNLTKMKELYPDTLQIHLSDNYRSSGSILQAAQALIEQDGARPDKRLAATHCVGTPPCLRYLPSADDEAQWIVSEIKRSKCLSGDLFKYSDFAILLRSAFLSQKIESAFGKHGIPYRMVGGKRFFDRVEVKVLLDYLRVVAQPDNSDALSRIINIPARRIGDTTITSLLAEATTGQCSLWKVIKDSVQGKRRTTTKVNLPQSQGLARLTDIILSAGKRLEDLEDVPTPHLLLQHVIKKIDFLGYLKSNYPEDFEVRWENVEELMAQAGGIAVLLQEDDDDALPDVEGIQQDLRGGAAAMLNKFLANVALSTELQSQDDVDDDGKQKEKITISTIHAAKGLEWPVVFIPAIYQGSLPHSRAEDTDEERRLLYVAMTRAQALLYLTFPKKDTKGEETVISPFITHEVNIHLADRGPLFEWDVVGNIAGILRRPIPPTELIAAAYGKVESHADDQWPHDGEPRPEDIEGRSLEWHESKRKRRKIWDEDADDTASAHRQPRTFDFTSARTTMQKAPTFTCPGFAPASTLPPSLNQQVSVEKDKTAGKILLKKRNAAKAASGQSSLINMWGAKSSAPEALPANYPFAPITLSRNRSDSSQQESRSPPRLHKASSYATELPQSSAELESTQPAPQPKSDNPSRPHLQLGRAMSRPTAHRPDEDEPSLGYINLSSSPTRPTSCHANRLDRPRVDFRPATTMHSTSMNKISNAANGTPKKALGMRRTMNGWNIRGGRAGIGRLGDRLGAG